MRTIISACTVAFLFCLSGGGLAYAQEAETYDVGTYAQIFLANPAAVFSIVNGQGLNGTRGIQPLNTSYTINYLRKGPFDLSIAGATLEITTFFKVAKPTSTNLGVATLELGFAQDQTATSFIAPYQTGTISWSLEPKSLIDSGGGFQFDTWVHVSVYNGSSSAGFSWGVAGNTILKSNNWYKATLQVSPVNSTTLRLWGFIDDYGLTGQSYIGRVDTVGTDNASGNASYPFTPFTTDATMYPALHGMSSGGLSVVDQTAIMDVAPPRAGSGPHWTQTTAPEAQYPNTAWGAVASSADGSRLVAVQHAPNSPGPGGGGIWTSSDFGSNWVQTSAPSSNWWAVASSANGQYLAAGIVGGRIWRSADYGTTWTQTSTTSGYWISIAASADGSKFFAAMEYGGIYSSSNFGVTWTQTTAPSTSWYGIASSTNGTRLIAIDGTGGIWLSTNSGGTWSQTTAPSTHTGSYWQSVASSADGSRLVAVMYYGGIYTSSDFGSSWGLRALPDSSATNWDSVACSWDGRLLVAESYPDIYTSKDFGSTWDEPTAPSGIWNGVAMSTDGRRLVAVDYGGGIYTANWLATVALGNLSQTYNGGPRNATATTSPVGLTVNLTYNGSGSPPISAGSYTVIGTVNDPLYQGSSTGTLVISKAAATVTLGNLSQTYNGGPRSATATTSPVGLAVTLTYNGSPNAPTNTGSYTVVGTINDVNYQGSATGTLVVNPLASAIIIQPQSQTVAAGTNVGFNVVAEGTPPLAYQWAFNGTNVAGWTSSSLNLGNVQLANAGYYQVRVTNVSGWAFSLVASLSVVAPMTNGAGVVGAPVGLVDWWPAEGNANDMAGPNNGTPTNAVSYVPGQVGLAFSFDGLTSSISVGASNIPPPWTACFWANRQDASGSSAALMASSGYALKLEQFNLTRRVGITAYGVADYAFNYTAPLATWVHLVFVGTGSNTLLYANGVLQDSLPVNIPLPRTYVGAAASFDHLQGSLDEISLFNRALSAPEIQYIFFAGSDGLYVGLGPVVQPQLEIAHQGGNVRLSWPVVYSNCYLVSSAVLPGGVWITNTSPRTTSGSNITATLPATNSRVFYRLAPRR